MAQDTSLTAPPDDRLGAGDPVPGVAVDDLVEDVSIDGMCGVY